ncbi:hypothetical protein GR140_17275 [Pseudomonas putida]|uniref:hypothetical protein n=1 Tax=Pseudomonas putida TaxID=303 RepID=UPI001BAF0B5E|nr:hypothetical protein [Pseudomonas putida]QUG90438.1 hypothetical protein GR140_17275 [Pseudomonas putida]
MANNVSNGNPGFLKKVEKYGMKLGELIPGLDKPTTIIRHLRDFHDEQKEIRIDRYCKALVNFISMEEYSAASELATDIEFADLLQACVNDSDSNKAESYAQLTIMLKFGALEKEYRRHFIFSLKQLSYEGLELLRLAHVASKYQLIPHDGSWIMSQSEIFNNHKLGVIGAISVAALRQLGFVGPKGITDLGNLFVKSVYGRERCESHEDHKVWQNSSVMILTNGMQDEHCDYVIASFKRLRILCFPLPILSFPRDIEHHGDHKAIIFTGNYYFGPSSSSHQREVADFTTLNHNECIGLDCVMPSGTPAMSFRNIDFGDAVTLDKKIEKVARWLGYIVD